MKKGREYDGVDLLFDSLSYLLGIVGALMVMWAEDSELVKSGAGLFMFSILYFLAWKRD